MVTCHFSVYQLARLMSLVDLAVESNDSRIETHEEYLKSLTEIELSSLDSSEIYFSDMLRKDNDFLRDIKRRLGGSV